MKFQALATRLDTLTKELNTLHKEWHEAPKGAFAEIRQSRHREELFVRQIEILEELHQLLKSADKHLHREPLR